MKNNYLEIYKVLDSTTKGSPEQLHYFSSVTECFSEGLKLLKSFSSEELKQLFYVVIYDDKTLLQTNPKP